MQCNYYDLGETEIQVVAKRYEDLGWLNDFDLIEDKNKAGYLIDTVVNFLGAQSAKSAKSEYYQTNIKGDTIPSMLIPAFVRIYKNSGDLILDFKNLYSSVERLSEDIVKYLIDNKDNVNYSTEELVAQIVDKLSFNRDENSHNA